MPSNQPSHSYTDSDADSDAPEAISLSSSKKTSEAQEKSIRAHEIQRRAKKKDENRERDRSLKEEKAKRMERNRREESFEGKRVGMTTVEERMERAMKQAEEEGSEDESDEYSIDDKMEDGDEEEEWHGIDNEDQSAEGFASKQLPDHIFTAAAATVSKPSTSTLGRPTDKVLYPEGKTRKKKKNKSKELIIGNRAVKVLSDFKEPLVGEYQPPPQVNRFIERELRLHNQEVTVATTPSLAKRSGRAGRPKTSKDSSGMKSSKVSRSKSWNRMPPNLGVMRRFNGPASNFVRGATLASSSSRT